MTNKHKRFISLLLISILFLAGCGGQPTSQTPPTLPPPPATHTAVPAALNQEEPTTVPAATTATAIVDAAATMAAAATEVPEDETTVAGSPTTEAATAEAGAIDPTAALTPIRLANMTYSSLIIPGEQVTLANGLYEEAAAPGSAATLSVRFSDIAAFGNVDESYRAAAILISESGGSGTFYTLHLVGLEDGQPRELGSILLGDRVIINELAIEDGQITIDLTRAGAEYPLCCPTERVRQIYLPGADSLVLVKETAVVEGPDAPGSTADLVARGIEMDVTGLAKTYAWVVERAAPQTDPPRPARLLLTFDGQSTAEALAGEGPLLAIYPLQPYLDLVAPADGSQSAVGDQVARLRELVESTPTRSGPPDGWMPLLPPPEERVDTWRDYATLSFGDGPGLRYVSQAGDTPVYTYLGYTADGRYLVVLTWPLAGAETPALEALDGMVATLALGPPQPGATATPNS
jgi:hypothetical protein